MLEEIKKDWSAILNVNPDDITEDMQFEAIKQKTDYLRYIE
jgi:hypothetical protein